LEYKENGEVSKSGPPATSTANTYLTLPFVLTIISSVVRPTFRISHPYRAELEADYMVFITHCKCQHGLGQKHRFRS